MAGAADLTPSLPQGNTAKSKGHMDKTPSLSQGNAAKSKQHMNMLKLQIGTESISEWPMLSELAMDEAGWLLG